MKIQKPPHSLPQEGVTPYVFITSLLRLHHGRFYEKRKVGGERKSLPLSAHSVDMSIGMRSLRPSPVHPCSRLALVGEAELQLGAAAPAQRAAISVPPPSTAQRGLHRATPQALTGLSRAGKLGIIAASSIERFGHHCC